MVTPEGLESILFSLIPSKYDREALARELAKVPVQDRAAVVAILRAARWRQDALAGAFRVDQPIRKHVAERLRTFQTKVEQARNGLQALVNLHVTLRQKDAALWAYETALRLLAGDPLADPEARGSIIASLEIIAAPGGRPGSRKGGPRVKRYPLRPTRRALSDVGVRGDAAQDALLEPLGLLGKQH